MSTIPPPPPIGGSPDDGKDEPPTYTPPPPPPIAETPPAPTTPVSPATPQPPPRVKTPPQPATNLSSGAPTAKKTKPVNVSLILGVLGFCGVTAIIGLIFGFIALSESKKNEGQGKVLAIVAIAINAFWLVLLAIGLISSGSSTSASP